MGIAIDRESFSAEDYKRFRQRLAQQLDYLDQLLRQPALSQATCSFGAELEMSLVDSQLDPSPCNTELIAQLNHPQLCEELNRFNLEFNLSPVSASGMPFSAMEQELRPFLDHLQTEARGRGAQLVPIGILPTLREEHLQRDYMTELTRYRVLSKQLSQLRGEPFRVTITGEEPLRCQCNDVTLEGANTSLQVHLRTPADQFANWYNAAQLTTPLVLALAANSPILLGHRLWQETRIALFKQSIDARQRGWRTWRRPARVSFGNGWLRDGAWELFAENVALHQPLFPLIDEQSPLEACQELRLHHGSVWPWNRAVLGTGSDPHLRVEYRALPSGPTVSDMMANAALAIGWTVALAEQMDALLPQLPFSLAEYNFYRAAQKGLDAQLIWPSATSGRPVETPVTEVIQRLLPEAVRGLISLGVEQKEVDRLLTVIEARLASRQTGSRWQLKTLDEYMLRHDRQRALKNMLQQYIDLVQEGNPVAQWT